MAVLQAFTVLAVDIGNTNITVGLGRNGRTVRKMKMPTAVPARYEKRLAAFLGRGASPARLSCVISSVVPPVLPALEHALRRLGVRHIVVTGRDVRVPIENRYRKKREVGQDRLVNAYAARELYGSPAVIIDFGTAVTFDIVSRQGAYLGGLIMPGVGISLASLHEKTALLPKVELKRASGIIGRDTVSSMRGGILFGFGAMCDGLIARYRQLLGKGVRVIMTGGNARLIERYTGCIDIIDEDITLKGLYILSNKKVS